MERRILKAAAHLFNSKGYAGATTRELAQSLGLQRASLYHYLASKQDLLYAICAASIEIVAQRFSEAVESAPPENRLRDAIRAHISALKTDRDLHTVMLTEVRSLDPDRREMIRKLSSAYEGKWRDLLYAEQRAGRLRSDIDGKFLTLSLLSVINFPIARYRASDAKEPDALSDLLADLFLEGTSPRPPAAKRRAAKPR